MTRFGYPGIDRRPMGNRGATTKVSSRNLGGERSYDPDHAITCRCGEAPRLEWRALTCCKGQGRMVCACGRASGWCRTKKEAMLHWNEMGSEPICSSPRRIGP